MIHLVLSSSQHELGQPLKGGGGRSGVVRGGRGEGGGDEGCEGVKGGKLRLVI